MNIKQIHIINYKNHRNLELKFNKKIVCFVGLNGVGKTNILDAIYFSCIGKSYFTSSDKKCVQHQASFFRIESLFEDHEVVITYENEKRKKLVLNDIPVPKLSAYLGLFPVVVIAPNDNALILANSDERRKFIDQTLFQTDKDYVSSLTKYNKILQQRNALLKNAEKIALDYNLLEIYNKNISPLGEEINVKRLNFIKTLEIYFKKAYKQISQEKEKVSIKYKSALTDQKFESLLKINLEKDKMLKRTTEGLHKDDLIFLMDEEKIKAEGSQGQQKTYLLALKLAQYDYLREKLQKPTICIIDDIFDKLDSERNKSLVKFVCENIEQVFISHTHENMLKESLKDFEYQLIPI